MKFHFWHTTLSLFFAAVAVLAYCWLDTAGRLPVPGSVSLGDFVLMTLAIFRLVRLFTYDNITAFIREWFAGADPRSLMGSLGTLINCPWCTGLWFALVVGFAYFATPIAWYAILVLALSSSASFVQLIANLIGWHAEAKKLDVGRMQ
jgi:hypothetical protein